MSKENNNKTPEQVQLFAQKAVKARPKKRARRKHQVCREEQLDLFLSLKQSSLI